MVRRIYIPVKPEIPAQAAKTCLECEHLYFSAAEPGYSEYTPGCDAHMSCNKNVWVWDAFDDHVRQLKDKLYAARACEEFKEDTHSLR